MVQISINNASSRSDIAVAVRDTACGRDFDFILKQHHISATPGQQHGKTSQDNQDWFVALNEEEKAEVYNKILAEYRKPSIDRDGFKSAAIGVIENPNPAAPPQKRHLLYIGVNTEQSAKAYFKDCAEQNMVNGAVNSIAQNQSRKGGIENPEAAKVKLVAVMAGSERVPIACPCGKCADMLDNAMTEDGKILIFPANNGDMKLKRNTSAQVLKQIRPGEIWETGIAHLNANRTVELQDNLEQAQDGLRQAIRFARQYHAYGDDALRHGAKLGDTMQDWAALIAKDAAGAALDEEERYQLKTIQHTIDNQLTGRSSVPQLDAAVENGIADIARMDAYLQQQVLITFANRLERAHQDGHIDFAHDSDDDILAWCYKEGTLNHVGCVVVQFDDGRCYSALDVDSAFDNAYPNPEVTATMGNMQELGTKGMVRIFAKSLNPALLAEGKMFTSNKEGLERPIKRRSKEVDLDDLMFTYLPMHDGTVLPERIRASEAEYSYGVDDIFVSFFSGTSQLAKLLTRAVSESGTAPTVAVTGR